MITFKAKLLNEDHYIEGNSLVYEEESERYIISETGFTWIDGRQWYGKYWDFIDITTLKITHEK